MQCQGHSHRNAAPIDLHSYSRAFNLLASTLPRPPKFGQYSREHLADSSRKVFRIVATVPVAEGENITKFKGVLTTR